MNGVEIIPAGTLKREFVQGLSLEIIKRVNEKLKTAASQGESSAYIDFSEMSIKPTQIEDLNDDLSGAGYTVILINAGMVVIW